jgi:hypothetical protein
LEAKVSQRVYDAVQAHATDKSLTLSTALSCILIDWEKSERRRRARLKKIEAELLAQAASGVD